MPDPIPREVNVSERFVVLFIPFFSLHSGYSYGTRSLLLFSVFICTGDTPWLNGKHAVFGKVTGGMDVVWKIASKGTEMGKPKATITIADCGAL
jgi:hypothetical protein